MESPTEFIRLDGSLINALTGMGLSSRDKTTATVPSLYRRLLSQSELESLYMCGLPKRFVDAIADEALKHHVTIKIGGETGKKEAEQINKFETYLRRIGFYTAFAEAQRLQRIYGGAVLLMLTDDSIASDEADAREAFAQPLDYGRITSLKGFAALSRWDVTPEDYSILDYSKPTYYRLNTNEKLHEDQQQHLMAVKIHHTRVIRFDGLYLPWSIRQQNQGWGQAPLQVLWDAWKRYESAVHGLESTINDGSQFWHKIPGLMQAIKAGNQAEVMKRLEVNVLARSVYGGMLLDAGAGANNPGEEIGFTERSLSNMAQATSPFAEYLQATTGWPASVLMGTSPGGLGKEGRFEERVWAGIVEKWQKCYTRDAIEEAFRVVMLSKDGPTRGREIKDWQVEFPSVFVRTEEEEADLRRTHADTDRVYVDMGVLHAMEVRESRFGGVEYGNEIDLNEAYSDLLEQEAQAKHMETLSNIESTLMQNQQNYTDPAQQQQGGALGGVPGGGGPSAIANASQQQQPLAAGAGAPPEGGTTAEVEESGGIVFPDEANEEEEDVGSDTTEEEEDVGSDTTEEEEDVGSDTTEEEEDVGSDTTEEEDDKFLEELLQDSVDSGRPDRPVARYDAHGLSMEVVSTCGDNQFGKLIAKNAGTSTQCVCILGPSRARRHAVYQGYVADGRPGPLLTGFSSQRAAKAAMAEFSHRYTDIKKVPAANLPKEFFTK